MKDRKGDCPGQRCVQTEMASSPHQAKSILERQRKMDYFEWDSIEHWNVEQRQCCDLPLLPIAMKRILCKHDCSMVPITNNQLGVWRVIKSLEAFWGVERDPFFLLPQPSSPDSCNVTQDEETDVGEELTVHTSVVTAEGSRFSVLEAPPPLVKKIERDKNISKKPKLTYLFESTQ